MCIKLQQEGSFIDHMKHYFEAYRYSSNVTISPFLYMTFKCSQ